jgi:uncharacterized protein (DUF433 family)
MYVTQQAIAGYLIKETTFADLAARYDVSRTIITKYPAFANTLRIIAKYIQTGKVMTGTIVSYRELN